MKTARKNIEKVLKKNGQSTIGHIQEIKDGLEAVKTAITDYIALSKSTRLRSRLEDAEVWLEKIDAELKK